MANTLANTIICASSARHASVCGLQSWGNWHPQIRPGPAAARASAKIIHMIPGWLRGAQGQRCAPTHKMQLMDEITEKVQQESQHILPTATIELSFFLDKFRHVYDNRSRTEQISLITLSRSQVTIAAGTRSALTHGRALQKIFSKKKKNFCNLIKANNSCTHSSLRVTLSKILVCTLNKGTTSHQ